MFFIKRRQFLQWVGVSLTICGISQLKREQASLHYGKLLAQDTRRKRALLVGINDYPGTSVGDFKQGLWYQLKGAVNDVELQRELLIYRFGFHPDDILILTDKEATRQNILDGLEKHLIQWVKSEDDVVVFHYSGHGSTVIDPDKIYKDGLNGTIVPYDAILPDGFPQKGGEVDDITAGTIFLLREALSRQTKNVTFILDSCYSGGGVRGNLIVRSRPGQALVDQLELRGDSPTTKLELSQAEIEYQQRWLTDLKLSREEWIDRRQKKLVNGAAIFAAQRNQEAVDAAFAQDVHAGVFTYSLTRQLWQQTSNQAMGKVIVATAAKTEQFLQNSRTQNPGIEVGSTDEQQPMYFAPMQNPAAEAVITEVTNNNVKLLLTGVEPQVLEALGKGAVFTLVDYQGKPQGSVKIQSRDRLQATGILQNDSGVKISAGATLQEQIRAIPSDLKLRIGIDRSLNLNLVKEALRSLPRIEVVPLLEQEVHYILGRMLPDYRQGLEKRGIADLPNENSIGLFSVGFEPIPGSFGAADEAIDAAVIRLQTKFKLLLAARLIKLTLNSSSSRLNVVAEMTYKNRGLAAQSFTVRGNQQSFQNQPLDGNYKTSSLTQIKIDEPVQIWIENRENRNLYLAVLIVSPDGDIDVLFPFDGDKNAALVAAKEKRKVPNSVELSFGKPLGLAEVLIVASTAPIAKALKPLQALAEEQRNPRRTESQMAEKAEDAIAFLLEDLAGGTRGNTEQNAGVRLLDVGQMAALSISFEIVD